MTKPCAWKITVAVLLLCAAMAVMSPAQTFDTLASFDGTNGNAPFRMSLVQGIDGNLYGTTQWGGANGEGAVFKIGPAGSLSTVYSFCSQPNCLDGQNPLASLVLATDLNFYGTTYYGGADGGGTIFRITPSGNLTTIYSFPIPVNGYPSGSYSALIQATDGNLYGTTYFGGTENFGSVFKITLAGVLTILHSFDFYSEGEEPNALVQGSDGNFYGTTTTGGEPGGQGIVFKMTPSGDLTILHHFYLAGGATPEAGLNQGTDGEFYGTTVCCAGTVFKITSAGVLTVLYQFGGSAQGDGAYPTAAVIQATDGNFYGTTSSGGDFTCGPPGGCGTLFLITPGGTLTTLHNFASTEGNYPAGGLVQATNGNFYGTTSGGGASNDGTVFSLSTGLGPFVGFVRDHSKVGQTSGILGQGFTGATSVSFNGIPSSFAVKSKTFLETAVPAGATTGFVTVTTPAGTLASDKIFRVTPQLLNFDPPSGPVGTVVTITGVSLTQTAGVGFGDSRPAKFTVDSDLQVTATVPKGAKTGPVGIETPGGFAISSATFTVTP
jgi:uncharacterized repeat protein (TIGR03803 family)